MKAASGLFRRPAALWRRLARGHAAVALTICLVFGALLVVGLLAVRDPAAMVRLVGAFGNGERTGTGDSAGPVASPLTGAGDLGPDDPVVRFADTRVGHMLFAGRSSDQCRRLLFDNRSGQFYDAPGVFCGPPPETPAEESRIDRMAAVRKSFRK